MSERRKTKRFLERNKAVIHFSIEKDAVSREPNPAWTRDISIDGARLLTHRSYPPNTKLIISLELPKSKQIVKLWARVAWTHCLDVKGQFEVGVEFIHSLQTIHNLFKHLYGYTIQPGKKDPQKKDHSFPVKIAEI
jgi:hypothetical protein